MIHSKKIVEMKLLSPLIGDKITMPSYSTPGSAGVDMRACVEEEYILAPNSTWLMPTGLAIHIKDPGYAATLIPRSGLGHKHGIVLGNLVGLIDSDYQGQLFVSLWNRSSQSYKIQPNERMAQLVIIKVEQVEFEIVQEFDLTDRATGGFGHSGRQ